MSKALVFLVVLYVSSYRSVLSHDQEHTNAEAEQAELIPTLVTAEEDTNVEGGGGKSCLSFTASIDGTGNR